MLYILFAVYLAAINFFALLFVRKQKKAADARWTSPNTATENCCSPLS